ncbi:MAG: chemoreceptor glutamine deamidase CheD [Nitrospirota bacterium]
MDPLPDTLRASRFTRDDPFAHVRRMHDPRFPHEIAAILPGEFFVSADPMIVYTVLGSCVSACIRDPIAGIGGMNHFMLPAPKEHQSVDAWGGESRRYGSFAMEGLINEILKRGGLRHRLEVKLFGGGKIYDGNIDIGANNAAWVLEYLKNEGLQAQKTDLGDVYARKLYYFIDSGRVLMKKIQRLKNDTIFDREIRYQQRLAQAQAASDVTLF